MPCRSTASPTRTAGSAPTGSGAPAAESDFPALERWLTGIKSSPACRRIILCMNKTCLAWRGLLLAAVLIFAMLIDPVAASAHDMGLHPAPAAPGMMAGFHGHRAETMPGCCCTGGCTIRAGLPCSCSLSPLPPLAQRQRTPFAGGQPVAVAAMPPTRTARTPATESPAASIPIAAPPNFILFGNFRS